MSKIPRDIENPVDAIIIDFCSNIAPKLRNFNDKITPNHITIIGAIFGFLSLYFLYVKNIPLFVLFFSIFYVLDCLDGYYARRYDMVTEVGGLLDHTRDLLVYLGIIFILITKYSKKISIPIILIYLIFTVLMHIHMGYQQLNYEDREEEKSLDFLKVLCFDKEYINYSKYFGCGTYGIVTIILVIYLTMD